MPIAAKPIGFEEVAEMVGLNPGVARRYVLYMRARWPKDEGWMCKDGYAKEWALRFYSGGEYRASGIDGQRILERIYRGEECGGEE